MMNLNPLTVLIRTNRDDSLSYVKIMADICRPETVSLAAIDAFYAELRDGMPEIDCDPCSAGDVWRENSCEIVGLAEGHFNIATSGCAGVYSLCSYLKFSSGVSAMFDTGVTVEPRKACASSAFAAEYGKVKSDAVDSNVRRICADIMAECDHADGGVLDTDVPGVALEYRIFTGSEHAFDYWCVLKCDGVALNGNSVHFSSNSADVIISNFRVLMSVDKINSLREDIAAAEAAAQEPDLVSVFVGRTDTRVNFDTYLSVVEASYDPVEVISAVIDDYDLHNGVGSWDDHGCVIVGIGEGAVSMVWGAEGVSDEEIAEVCGNVLGADK